MEAEALEIGIAKLLEAILSPFSFFCLSIFLSNFLAKVRRSLPRSPRRGKTAGLEKNCWFSPSQVLLAVPVRITILGSGSSGNCAYVETGEVRLLVDAGFSLRQIRQRLAAIGKVPENLTGVLITHEHSDHIQGLPALSEKLHIPIFCNRETKDAAEYQLRARLDCRLFITGSSFQVGDVTVETFSVPHDAQDPVGFLLRTDDGALGFLTDLGHVTKLVLDRVRAANVLVLEANHDVKMLQDCPRRPWSLKQRILGRPGHLSHQAAPDPAEH